MKKTLLFSLAALSTICACQKFEAEETESSAINFVVGATIEGSNSKTAYVPDGKKVIWLKGDKMGLKYKKTSTTATKNDNIALSLVSGDGTCSAVFKGKLGTTNATPDGSVFVFYYPQVTTVAESGSVTDSASFVLGGNFPKQQNTNDVLFDANLMYGYVTNLSTWPTTTETQCPVDVQMKNVMSVIDFTLKGKGSVKRLYLTDRNSGAKAMSGKYTVNIKNGEFDGFATLPTAANEYDRTIVADFNKPIELSASGAHAYVTVMPRTYSDGIEVGLEMTNGEYMTAKISTPFTTESNKVYSASELTFSSQAVAGKGIYENTIYSYKTFTDDRDGQVYRYITADGNDWMIDNLRYLPEDFTPTSDVDSSANNGLWYPVIMNTAGNEVTFGTSAEAVSRFGYCYNPSVAFGQDPSYICEMQQAVLKKEMTATEALNELKALENTGICPTGWHIPTQTEYDSFYNANGKSISGIGVLGFVLKDFGYVAVDNPTATATKMNVSPKGYSLNKLNMSYILLSTPNSHTNYKAIMTNFNTNTAATANMSSRCGCAIRCVKKAN